MSRYESSAKALGEICKADRKQYARTANRTIFSLVDRRAVTKRKRVRGEIRM